MPFFLVIVIVIVNYPTLSPSDYFLFRNLKHLHLHACQSSSRTVIRADVLNLDWKDKIQLLSVITPSKVKQVRETRGVHGSRYGTTRAPLHASKTLRPV